MSERIDVAIQLMREAFAESQKCRDQAIKQRELVHQKVESEFHPRKGRSAAGDIELIKNQRVASDLVYKWHMGDSGWFRDTAETCALVAIAEMLYETQ